MRKKIGKLIYFMAALFFIAALIVFFEEGSIPEVTYLCGISCPLALLSGIMMRHKKDN